MTARLAAELGFTTAYVSGAGSAAARGLPDMSVMTLTELADAVAVVARSADLEVILPRGAELYATACGQTLARAHARAGDRVAIAAYLGGSARFDEAIARFAVDYADQNERDYAAFAEAASSGRLTIAEKY